jgi:hypothetical protein
LSHCAVQCGRENPRHAPTLRVEILHTIASTTPSAPRSAAANNSTNTGPPRHRDAPRRMGRGAAGRPRPNTQQHPRSAQRHQKPRYHPHPGRPPPYSSRPIRAPTRRRSARHGQMGRHRPRTSACRRRPRPRPPHRLRRRRPMGHRRLTTTSPALAPHRPPTGDDATGWRCLSSRLPRAGACCAAESTKIAESKPC